MLKKAHPSAVIVCLILAAVCAVSAVITGCTKEVTVPDVIGMTSEEAETALTADGLTMTVQRERYSKKNPEGSVDGMVTKAGETVESGSEVKVILSLGEGREVPNLWALTGKEAENLVAKVGLNPIIVEEYSDEVEEGNIISYTDSGQTLPKGADVTITVSKGPEG